MGDIGKPHGLGAVQMLDLIGKAPSDPPYGDNRDIILIQHEHSWALNE